MEKILEKLETMMAKYLDEIETKPVKTLLITILVYYLFRAIGSNKK